MSFKTFILIALLIGFTGFVFLVVIVALQNSQPQEQIVQTLSPEPQVINIQEQPRRQFTWCTNGPLGIICTSR